MRAALISIVGQPRRTEGQGHLELAGKTIARRQLDFVLAAGCGQVFVLGDGASAEAIALRHVAEGAGARFQAIGTGHGLLGAVGATDDLLAIAPGLLPESSEQLAQLQRGPVILVMPAEPAVAAGLERIDVDRAWAGALVVRGRLVERLAELPPESEPAAALLRIALQARVPEHRVPEQLLADGGWSVVPDGDETPLGREWIDRHFPRAASWSPSALLAERGLRPLAGRLLATPRSSVAMVAGTVALLAGGIVAAALGWPAPAFGLVALAAVAGDASGQFAELRRAPLMQGADRGRWPLPLVTDLALAACAALAIAGAPLHRLFPPLVLLGLLHVRAAGRGPSPADLSRDRAVIGLILAAASAFGLAETAIMLVALVLLATNVAQSAASRG